MTSTLTAALEALAANLSIVPIKADGSKMPPFAWKQFQQERATTDEAEGWFWQNPSYGLAVLGGEVSGNLEWIDFDDLETIYAFCATAEALGLRDLVERIYDGYGEASPEGFHLAYRCPEIAGSLELAKRPNPAKPNGYDTLIETRGEGGYCIVAPSNGRVHPSGMAYELKAGGFESIVAITTEERQTLHDLARSFDEMPTTDDRPPQAAGTAGDRPGDAFNEEYTGPDGWEKILSSHGWQRLFTRSDGTTYWRRAGKDHGWSATSGHGGHNCLYVFTSSTVFERNRGYTPFTAYAILDHGGDFSAAARELSRQAPPNESWRAENRSDNAATTWPELDPLAFHGLAGDVVAAFEPLTESDPVAMLASYLVAFGNCAGPSPKTYVSETRHGLNEFAVTVGETSRSRKGTSWGPIERVFTEADRAWTEDRKASGIGSGEGIVWAIRDPSEPRENPKTGETIIEDQGVADKRLMIHEQELSGILRVANRDGSILSEIIRKCFDSESPLRNMVKRSPVKATSPHISILGHVTLGELRRELSETAQVNGFANRFLWLAVRRSKLLPDAPRLDHQAVGGLAARTRQALTHARSCSTIRRDEIAAEHWRAIYPELSRDYPGMFGAITARAEAHVLRLSMIYAMLDCSSMVRIEHLHAALALWQYCADSARYIFGDATGDPVADKIMAALKHGPMTETDIYNLLGRHQSRDRMQHALQSLRAAGKAICEDVSTGGRPARTWKVTGR